MVKNWKHHYSAYEEIIPLIALEVTSNTSGKEMSTWIGVSFIFS